MVTDDVCHCKLQLSASSEMSVRCGLLVISVTSLWLKVSSQHLSARRRQQNRAHSANTCLACDEAMTVSVGLCRPKLTLLINNYLADCVALSLEMSYL
jgi:cytochrome c553